jgi:hypothetical protein
MELFLHVAELVGATTERQIAELAEVSVDNVANWKSGSVKEFKVQTLKAVKDNLRGRLMALRDELGQHESTFALGLVPVEIEEASGPAALQRQFADRMIYDYLGHRFLYFDPQGALAWENLIKAGYEQDHYLAGVRDCMKTWTTPNGALSGALGLGGRVPAKGLDVISLGPGEGSKEAIILEHLLRLQGSGRAFSWLTLGLVDVSIPLLLRAAKAAKQAQLAAGDGPAGPGTVLPICADFEEGALTFTKRLPSFANPELPGTRLALVLGNTFGNLRDEEHFLTQKLNRLLRPGDLLWLEVGLRPDNIEDEPLYAMTKSGQETAAFSNRRLLLEGPYRRWEAAIGRPPSELDMRIWVRERDETSRVPGSLNFCHDMVIKNERRVCTMLYSRRYDLAGLRSFLERQGYRVLDTAPVQDSHGYQRTMHLLAEKR